MNPTDSGNETATLSSLLELREDSRHVWPTDELGAILKHQLHAPLRLSFGEDFLPEVVAHGMGNAEPGTPATLEALLHHTQPPVELLRRTKQFAKQCVNQADSPLPREIALVLYYASIAIARWRGPEDISGLSSTALGRGLEWVRAQPWMDAPLQSLLQEIIPRLDGRKLEVRAPRELPADED